jgi:hypothetical protein
MTPAQRRALETAAQRERGTICPIPGAKAAAETALLRSLIRAGWSTDSEVRPTITDLGRKAIGERHGA